MNNTKVHQTNEDSKRNAGNTSAESIYNKSTLNHHPVEASINKAYKGTTLNHQANHLAEAQERESKDIQKITMISEGNRTAYEGQKSTMEGGHTLNKMHIKGTMKQQN
jgi:hypothetical protein